MKGLVIGGSIALAVGWALGFGIGSSAFKDNGAYTLIPVAGPFIAAATRHTSGLDLLLYRTSMYMTGVMQATGAVLLTVGLSVSKPQLVPDRGFSLLPMPFAGPNGAGLGLAGTF
ncbi:Hypothetical protein A7982_08122 [Minicystis rosea]|nr:Hypothetical protein A7982_08122 [Minicystis rosea]